MHAWLASQATASSSSPFIPAQTAPAARRAAREHLGGDRRRPGGRASARAPVRCRIVGHQACRVVPVGRLARVAGGPSSADHGVEQHERPGRVIVSWQPCLCDPARAAQPRGSGHWVIACRAPGCTAEVFEPPHDPATAGLPASPGSPDHGAVPSAGGVTRPTMPVICNGIQILCEARLSCARRGCCWSARPAAARPASSAAPGQGRVATRARRRCAHLHRSKGGARCCPPGQS